MPSPLKLTNFRTFSLYSLGILENHIPDSYFVTVDCSLGKFWPIRYLQVIF